MIARGQGGAIVNLSSQASQVALADHAAYCASKGALDQLTRVMALELGPHQIRVNAVNPTVTLTSMGALAWGDPAKGDPMKAKIPLGRFALPRDVAHAVAYLLSDQADMIHGVTLPVDGGFLAT
jgi:NAD(P)-dependent dehydrogenase (short-subunit alcohol dehydrogenase family)